MHNQKPAVLEEDLLPEYRLDYSKARPNRFAHEAHRLVLLDVDVAEVFQDPEQVNAVLRALIATMPKSVTRSAI